MGGGDCQTKAGEGWKGASLAVEEALAALVAVDVRRKSVGISNWVGAHVREAQVVDFHARGLRMLDCDEREYRAEAAAHSCFEKLSGGFGQIFDAPSASWRLFLLVRWREVHSVVRL